MTRKVWQRCYNPAMLILASNSKARNSLLRQAGLNFTAQSPDVDERHFQNQHPALSLGAVAEALAVAKALSVSTRNPKAHVIGSDQTLCCHNQLLHQPATEAGLRLQLHTLRGKTHTLHSAVAVTRDNQVLFRHTTTATLQMRHISDAFCEDYIKKAGPDVLSCVGGYQVEALGIQLFEHIDGDPFTIQGLPLLPLLGYLRHIGELAS